jgi:hypothetical protein
MHTSTHPEFAAAAFSSAASAPDSPFIRHKTQKPHHRTQQPIENKASGPKT